MKNLRTLCLSVGLIGIGMGLSQVLMGTPSLDSVAADLRAARLSTRDVNALRSAAMDKGLTQEAIDYIETVACYTAVTPVQ